MKKVLLFAVIIACLTACQGPKIQEINVDEFNAKAPELVDQTISLKGIAKHICHNSGRKLFLASTPESENLVTVMAGENMDKFDVETEGRNYTVEGFVKVAQTIDEAYLDQWQKEVEEQGVKEGEHICATEQQAEGIVIADSVANPQLEKIAAYREKIAANGNQPIVFYQVECTSFQVAE